MVGLRSEALAGLICEYSFSSIFCDGSGVVKGDTGSGM